MPGPATLPDKSGLPDNLPELRTAADIRRAYVELVRDHQTAQIAEANFQNGMLTREDAAMLCAILFYHLYLKAGDALARHLSSSKPMVVEVSSDNIRALSSLSVKPRRES